MRKLLTILTLGLTACGGGGGGSTRTSSTSSPAAQNLQMAPMPAQVLSPTYSLTNLTATDSSGNVFYLAISDTADAGTASFDGQMANYNTLGVAITENTNPNPVLSLGAVAFYLTGPYSPLGEEITQNGVTVETAADFLHSSVECYGRGLWPTGRYFLLQHQQRTDWQCDSDL